MNIKLHRHWIGFVIILIAFVVLLPGTTEVRSEETPSNTISHRFNVEQRQPLEVLNNALGSPQFHHNQQTDLQAGFKSSEGFAVGIITGTYEQRVFLPVIMTPPKPITSRPILNEIADPDWDGEYTVSWGAVANANSYILEEDITDSFSNPIEVYNGPNTATVVTGQPAGTYFYRVKAANTLGASDWSDSKSITLESPSSPVLDDITDPDWDGQYIISWSEVANADSYILEEDVTYSFSNPVEVYNGSETSTIITGRTAGTYFYRIKTVNTLGISDWSTSESIALEPPPSPVLNEILNPYGLDTFLVSWSVVDRTINYILEEDIDNSFSDPTNSYVITSSSITVTVANTGNYYYRVISENAYGSSDWSNVVSTEIVEQAVVPEAGYYAGTSPTIHFDVTSSQQVCNLYIRFTFTPLSTCTIAPINCEDIVDGEFVFSSEEFGAIYTISGNFETENLSIGNYSASMCGNTIVYPPASGNWAANLQ